MRGEGDGRRVGGLYGSCVWEEKKEETGGRARVFILEISEGTKSADEESEWK